MSPAPQPRRILELVRDIEPDDERDLDAAARMAVAAVDLGLGEIDEQLDRLDAKWNPRP